ncbi:MAG: hypothetical protein IPI04_16740 [Ignavibacteria bacterium]|nr:hypothetical protein [Ignavibacteria bacterium]
MVKSSGTYKSSSANNLIAYWSFNTNNTPKSSEVCNSDPVLIPAPEGNTHLNLNLWLNRGNYPSNNQEAEVIIHDINFVPSVLSSKPMLKD